MGQRHHGARAAKKQPPCRHASFDIAQAAEFVHTVHVLVGQTETEEDSVDAERRSDSTGHRNAAPGIGIARLRSIHFGQHGGGKLLEGIVRRNAIRARPAGQDRDPGPEPLGYRAPEKVLQQGSDGIRILARHQSAGQAGAGRSRNDGPHARGVITRLDCVDLYGRAEAGLLLDGILNSALIKFGLIDTPLAFIGTNTAVVFALAYYLLPYMILSLYSVMNGIDRNLLLAARNLGASPMAAFRHVFLPLTRPGVLAGSYMVFMLGIGMYITPAMLGGPEQTTLPLMIAIQINEAMDWTFAAALSVILLLVTGSMQLMANRFLDFERLWGGAK